MPLRNGELSQRAASRALTSTQVSLPPCVTCPPLPHLAPRTTYSRARSCLKRTHAGDNALGLVVVTEGVAWPEAPAFAGGSWWWPCRSPSPILSVPFASASCTATLWT